MNRRWILASLLLWSLSAGAATLEQIIERNKHVLDGVTDFTAIMTFTVRSADMRVPPSRVKIYFKKPDKFKPEPLDGDFAVLPNTYHLAIGNVLERLLKGNKAALVRQETLNNRAQYLIKITPKTSDSPLSYHLVYVDTERFTVTRVVTTPKHDQPATLKMSYEAHGKAWLPSEASIDGYHKTKDKDGQLVNQAVQVKLTFAKYRVNVGLSDKLFDS